MKPIRYFKCTETPFPAVDAVLLHGFAILSDDTQFTEPFAEKVIAALKPYDDVNPHVDYIKPYYVIVDRKRFPLGEGKERLAEVIQSIRASLE